MCCICQYKTPIIALFQGVKAYYDRKAEYKKNFNITWLLLYGAGLITVGILVLVNGKIVVEPAARLGGIFIVANGIHRLIRAYARHQRLPVFSGIGNIIIGLISVFFPAATLALLSFIFSLYVFLNALVKFIDFGTALKNAVPDAFYDFFREYSSPFSALLCFSVLLWEVRECLLSSDCIA